MTIFDAKRTVILTAFAAALSIAPPAGAAVYNLEVTLGSPATSEDTFYRSTYLATLIDPITLRVGDQINYRLTFDTGAFTLNTPPVVDSFNFPTWMNVGIGSSLYPIADGVSDAPHVSIEGSLAPFGATGPLGPGAPQAFASTTADGLGSVYTDMLAYLYDFNTGPGPVTIEGVEGFIRVTGFDNTPVNYNGSLVVGGGAHDSIVVEILYFSTAYLKLAPLPAPVPEPTGWALMICGAGLAGAALRRRRLARAG